jgi:hypothetical protein
MIKLNWTGVCHDERTAGISKLEQAINRHGFIINHKMFSDVSISLMIEVPANKINALYDELSREVALSAFDRIDTESDKDSIVFLSIDFAKATGNMRIAVPDIGD